MRLWKATGVQNWHPLLRLAAAVLGLYLCILIGKYCAGISKEIPADDVNRFDRSHMENENRQINTDKKVKNPAVDNNSHTKAYDSPHSRFPILSRANVRYDVITPHPFQYTLTPGFCTSGKENPFVVAYVHSAPQNMAQRAMIRETWANKAYHGNSSMEVFFATGLADNPGVQRSLEEESDVHRDILQEDYKDNYLALAHKGVGSLKWILNKCHNTKFILKTDDDTFVNAFSLLKHLRDLNCTGQSSDIFLCRLMPDNEIIRRGKSVGSSKVYTQDRYPPFCSGVAFVLSMDVAEVLYEASYHTPLTFEDDVSKWLTRTVAATANVNYTEANSMYDPNTANVQKTFLGKEWYQYSFGHLGLKYYRLCWDKLVVIAKDRAIPNSKVVVPGKVFSKTRLVPGLNHTKQISHNSKVPIFEKTP